MSDKPKKFRPANGTEGEIFIDGWCRNCARYKAMSEGADVDECDDNQLCKIIGDTMAYDITDPKYPVEWIYGEDGQPKCTAFVEVGKPVPPTRCDKTLELF